MIGQAQMGILVDVWSTILGNYISSIVVHALLSFVNILVLIPCVAA